MALFFTTEGDTEVPLRANMDLSGATVVGRVRPQGTTAEATQLSASVTNASEGVFTLPVAGLDDGPYDLQVKVTQADGTVTTFPNDGWDTLTVGESI